jgi:hypothetical protein
MHIKGGQMSGKTKTCTHCGETKPIDAFKRKLTKRQSCALLHRSSISQGIVVDIVRCNTCWLMTKSRKPMTKKQIRNKIESGDIKRVMGEILIKQINEATPQKRSRVMKEEWQKRKTSWVKTLNDNLQQQVDTYRNRYYGYKYAVNKTGQGQMSPDQGKQHATLEQHRLNYEQAIQIKKRLMDRAKSGEKIEVDVQIVMYFKKGEVQ